MNPAAVRAAEHLKDWVSEVIDKYHATDINPSQVKLLIWDEIQSTLLKLKPKHFQNVLWLRVIKNDVMETQSLFDCIDGEVLSSRYLGPRNEGDIGVFYIAVLTSNVYEAIRNVKRLIDDGHNVRDWSYGANRR